MRLLHLLVILSVCLILLVPADAWRRWRIRIRGRRIVRAVSRAVRSGIGCRLLYGVGCPKVVGGSALGQEACKIRKSKCKRTLMEEEEDLRALGMERVTFDADFDDYDDDKNGFISYDEFFDTVNSNVILEDPSSVAEPFHDADTDEDGKLNRDEFEAAPLDFEEMSPPVK